MDDHFASDSSADPPTQDAASTTAVMACALICLLFQAPVGALACVFFCVASATRGAWPRAPLGWRSFSLFLFTAWVGLLLSCVWETGDAVFCFCKMVSACSAHTLPSPLLVGAGVCATVVVGHVGAGAAEIVGHAAAAAARAAFSVFRVLSSLRRPPSPGPDANRGVPFGPRPRARVPGHGRRRDGGRAARALVLAAVAATLVLTAFHVVPDALPRLAGGVRRAACTRGAPSFACELAPKVHPSRTRPIVNEPTALLSTKKKARRAQKAAQDAAEAAAKDDEARRAASDAALKKQKAAVEKAIRRGETARLKSAALAHYHLHYETAWQHSCRASCVQRGMKRPGKDAVPLAPLWRPRPSAAKGGGAGPSKTQPSGPPSAGALLSSIGVTASTKAEENNDVDIAAWKTVFLRASASDRSDEFIVSRVALEEVLGVNILSFDYDGARFWLSSPLTGDVEVTIERVNGMQVALSSKLFPVIKSFMVMSGITMGPSAVWSQIPMDGHMHTLEPTRIRGEDVPQTVRVGILPARLHVQRTAIIDAVERKLDALNERVRRGEADALDAAHQMQKMVTVFGELDPDFAEAVLVEMNECKPYNGRVWLPDAESPAAGARVAFYTLNGDVVTAIHRLEFGFSNNFATPELQYILMAAGINMGTFTAMVRVRNEPIIPRRPGVDGPIHHHILLIPIDHPGVSAQDAVAEWGRLYALRGERRDVMQSMFGAGEVPEYRRP